MKTIAAADGTLPALARALASAGSVPSAAAIVFMSQRPNFIYTIYTLFHQWSCKLAYPVIMHYKIN